jgi:hypothetical protein
VFEGSIQLRSSGESDTNLDFPVSVLARDRPSNIPFRLRATQTAPDALATVLNADPAHRAAKSIGASIDGIGQDVVAGVL